MHKPELIIIGLDGAMTSYITKAMSEGRLPHFKRILESGVVCSNCMTAYPSITPTCWTTIATGAAPSVTNAIDHEIHIPGTELDEVVNGYNPHYLRGERFWQAAARIGKRSLLIAYPAMPTPNEGDGIFTILAYDSPKFGIDEQTFRINLSDSVKGGERCPVAFRDGHGDWMPVSDTSAGALALDGNNYILPGISKRKTAVHGFQDFSWHLRFEENGVSFGENADSLCVPIPKGAWTPVITRTLGRENGSVYEMHFQAKVLDLDLSAKSCVFYISGSMPVEATAAPPSYAELLHGVRGNSCRDPYRFILYRDKDNVSYAESYEKYAEWKLAAAKRTLEHENIDIFFCYESYIDTVNHIYRPAFEGIGNFSEAERELARDMYARAYDLADRTIGKILDAYADENTTVVLVSDHGSVGNTKSYQAYEHFIKSGLTVLDENGKIDWSETVAYAHPTTSGHAFVNLKGRDPQGIVEPADYPSVVERIIDTLNRTSDNAMAFALEREEADLVGQGGDSMCGDVVFGLRGGNLGGYVGGVHASQSPSAKTPTGDIRALCVFSGPAFQKGVTLKRPMTLADIAPTINYAMNYPLPSDATGGVIRQALRAQ